MSDVEIRLECAKLAVEMGAGPETLQAAADLYAFVTGPREEPARTDDQ
jgi:hypothetical protein